MGMGYKNSTLNLFLGKVITFRLVQEYDAEFILKLRNKKE